MNAFIASVISIFTLMLVKGFVLSKLYLWFIVTTFNVEALTVIQCIGLILIVEFTIPTNTNIKDRTIEEFITQFVYSVVISFLTLGLGWIVMQNM